jgi:sensor histidine kinase YesM
MIISIREYIDKIWEKAAKKNELREKEMEMRELYANAQLRALQNQINPHFLFNTLNTGAQLAMIEGADRTCYFMEQVADFFRYNIRQNGQDATIDEELALIDNFVYIMKVRFGERFEFIKNVSDEKHPQHLPRMILQPLVENCIKHGSSESKTRVVLSVETGLYMTKITVSDNGEGFSPELRESILGENPDAKAVSHSEDGNGTGLVNVISRLRLYFHRHDVFDILSNEDGGTTFSLRIPNV